MMDRPALMLFTKAPLPGRVKTRLLTHTTPETATAIALEMIRDTLSIAADCWPGPVRLLVSPAKAPSELTEMALRYNVTSGTQSQGDLGQKMQSAIREGLESSTAVAVMGCDIPLVTADILEFAFESLAKGANVIGPSADGGFYLIGTHQCVPGMLDSIAWSTDTVLQSVLARSEQLGVRFDVLLPCLNDIDSWEDFEHLASIVPKYRRFLEQPHLEQESTQRFNR
ncbi:MAG: TIGR04282 family arsenosugar biosynthesis glycosyltransferase [Acidiferrobacterales bacterium]|nr:TIGR04282 family arsenosugar biosynthesis glycosyltransferase [Acidiferrobacterales bacterium]